MEKGASTKTDLTYELSWLFLTFRERSICLLFWRTIKTQAYHHGSRDSLTFEVGRKEESCLQFSSNYTCHPFQDHRQEKSWSILASNNEIDVACARLNDYFQTMKAWLHRRNPELSPEKSSATLFTPWCQLRSIVNCAAPIWTQQKATTETIFTRRKTLYLYKKPTTSWQVKMS